MFYLCVHMYIFCTNIQHIYNINRNYSFNCIIKSERIFFLFLEKINNYQNTERKMHEAGAKIQRLILFRFYIISNDVNQYEQLYRDERNTQTHIRVRVKKFLNRQN